MRGNSCSIRIGIALFRGSVCSIRIGIALMRGNSCSIRMGLALGSGNSCGIRMGIAELARIIRCVTSRSVLIRKCSCSIPMACVFIRQGCVKSVSLAPKQTLPRAMDDGLLEPALPSGAFPHARAKCLNTGRGGPNGKYSATPAHGNCCLQWQRVENLGPSMSI